MKERSACTRTLGVGPEYAIGILMAMFVGFGLLFLISGPSILSLILGTGAAICLIINPEIALALYLVAGDVKGDSAIASLFPFDLTVALCAIIAAGITLNFLRKKLILTPPRSYFLFLPLVLMMTASLAYAPDVGAAVDKLGRFLIFTGIVITAPFFILSTATAFKKFLIWFGAAAFAICGYSLAGLGGAQRLQTPSDNTIGLGHVACALFLVMWFGMLPFLSSRLRWFVYPLLAPPAIAIIGSGSRGSLIALSLALIAGICFCRRLAIHFLPFSAIALLIVPFAAIPQASFDYLGTIAQNSGVTGMLDFRGNLLAYGWNLLKHHPLVGAGLGGFRYSSPNPALYKWPHNIFLEIACELGIPAALLIIVVFWNALREAFHQARDRNSPYFPYALLATALLLFGIVNGINTGNINSDRLTWFFVSLVFVVRGLRQNQKSVAVVTEEL